MLIIQLVTIGYYKTGLKPVCSKNNMINNQIRKTQMALISTQFETDGPGGLTLV